MGPCQNPDVIVLGAGLIGLSIALELECRGARVLVIERGFRLRGASAAAAGMLGADDPHNPPALRELARRSVDLYPAFLARLTNLSGLGVPFQTLQTVQYTANAPTVLLPEKSLDPRQLAAGMGSAVRCLANAGRLTLWEQTTVESVRQSCGNVEVRCAPGNVVTGKHVVFATGARGSTDVGAFGIPLPVVPCKGQMLRVAMPAHHCLTSVHRSAEIYVVPRTLGEQAGSAVIGATVEHAGFDLCLQTEKLDKLRSAAVRLNPALRWMIEASPLEAWAGLRPETLDGLPLIGRRTSGPAASSAAVEFVATGHFRNGILLAPATAEAIADLIEGRQDQVSLEPYDPTRFNAAKAGPLAGLD